MVCRYCRVSFEQWEKLVTHRRDEHREEFEALKNALLLKRQGEGASSSTKTKEPSSRTTPLNGLRGASSSPFSNLNKMKPIKRAMPPPQNAPAQKKTPSKEVDPKDLENKEVTLCIPLVGRRSSSQRPAGKRLSASLSFPTPPNGIKLFRSNGALDVNKMPRKGTGATPIPSCSSFLTPPTTPPSPAEELVLNVTWEVPRSKNVVHYHQMDDESEIEFCSGPFTSDGPRVSLTRHSISDFRVMNGNHHVKEANPPQAITRYEVDRSASRRTNHVIIEELNHELHITSSKKGGDDKTAGSQGSIVKTKRESGSPQAQGTSVSARMSGILPLPSDALLRKRLNSRFQPHNSRMSLPINLFGSGSNGSREVSRYQSTTTTSNNNNSTVFNQGGRDSRHTAGKAKITIPAKPPPRAFRRRPNQ